MFVLQAPDSRRPCVASHKTPKVSCVMWQLLTTIVNSSTSPRRGSRRRHSTSAHLDSSHRSLLRQHSLSTHLDPSQRGMLPVSHVFVDSSRLLSFLIAPPGHHWVRLLPVRAVVYRFGHFFCDCLFLAFHDSAAVPSALNQSTSQVTVLARPSLVGDHMHCITCISFGFLHVLLARLTIIPCMILCADNQLTHQSRCCVASLGFVCTEFLA